MEVQLIISLVEAIISGIPEVVAAYQAIKSDLTQGAAGPTQAQRLAALATYASNLAAAKAATPGA